MSYQDSFSPEYVTHFGITIKRILEVCANPRVRSLFFFTVFHVDRYLCIGCLLVSPFFGNTSSTIVPIHFIF